MLLALWAFYESCSPRRLLSPTELWADPPENPNTSTMGLFHKRTGDDIPDGDGENADVDLNGTLSPPTSLPQIGRACWAPSFR